MHHSVKGLQNRLERISGRRINLRINQNITNLLILNYGGAVSGGSNGKAGVTLSLHTIFLNAPSEVIKAVGSFINRATPANRSVIRRFIYENYDKVEAPTTQTRLKTHGKYYNLKEVLNRINRTYFRGKLRVDIGWMPPRGLLAAATSPSAGHQRRRRKKSLSYIQFATYDEKRRLIRVNPRLDSRRVPRYFMDYVIYHEMLHSVIPSKITPAGRMNYHTPEFREREKLFKDYDRARKWEETCFDKF